MKIRISGKVEVTRENGKPMTKAIARELKGETSDDECANYLSNELADLGIAGGFIVLTLDGDGVVATSEYSSPVKLTEAQLKRLADETYGQWSDGVGEGCFDAISEMLEVTIDLTGAGSRKELKVEQIDDAPSGKKAKGSEKKAKGNVAKAAREGDTTTLRALLDSGANLETRQQGHTPLHLAILYGHVEAALELIARGADVKAVDPEGHQPLMLAALGNSIKDEDAARVAEALLEKRVSIRGGAKAESPLWFARNRGKKRLEAVLLKHGAKK